MKKSILFPFSFFLLVLFSQPLFSQVKYTSGGYFGIGTTSPQKLLHLKDTHPYLWMEGGGNGKSLIRFTEGTNQWYGAYLCYNVSSNLFSIGMHNSSSSSTAYDAYMFKAGMYLYTLIVDGEIIDTKQMVIVE